MDRQPAAALTQAQHHADREFPENFEAADAAGVCLVGSLATVRDKFRAQVSEAGVNYLLCRVAFGDLPKELFVEDGRTGAA